MKLMILLYLLLVLAPSRILHSSGRIYCRYLEAAIMLTAAWVMAASMASATGKAMDGNCTAAPFLSCEFIISVTSICASAATLASLGTGAVAQAA